MNRRIMNLIVFLAFLAGAVSFAVRQDWLFSLLFLAISALFGLRIFKSDSNG